MFSEGVRVQEDLSDKRSLFCFDRKGHLVPNRDPLSSDNLCKKIFPPVLLLSVKESRLQTISILHERLFVMWPHVQNAKNEVGLFA